jgi:manganese/zinc/iron transport system substrate-binding protein
MFGCVSVFLFTISDRPALAAQKPLNVIATTGMIADAVREVGGDRVTVRALMGPGVDPHSFRQTRTDIVAMTRADVVLRHGLYLEAQMEEFFQRLGKSVPVIAVAEALPTSRLRAHDTYKNKFDPHVWMNPVLWGDVIVAIGKALGEIRPQDKSLFEANVSAYLARIEVLQSYAVKVLSSVPAEQRVLVTAHDAFGYFGAAYGYQVHGIQGISTESEAGLNRIKTLVDLLVDSKVAAVFVESSVSPQSIRALAEGAASRRHKVNVGGELFSDAMGPDGTYEGTYIGMIDHNVTTIARALGGEAPGGGMSGRLAVALKGN